MIDSGKMRHQVRIEQRSTTQDSSGDPQLTWSTFVEVRAAVEYSSGREVWASGQRQGRVPTVFTLRYIDGVLPSMRLVFRKTVYDILSAVDQEGRREKLIVTAVEHVEETLPS